MWSHRERVLAVCISERKGTMKHPVSEVLLRAGHGIEGDAHAGPWHRQVSLLATESVEPCAPCCRSFRRVRSQKTS